jgi:hypothetical protein
MLSGYWDKYPVFDLLDDNISRLSVSTFETNQELLKLIFRGEATRSGAQRQTKMNVKLKLELCTYLRGPAP